MCALVGFAWEVTDDGSVGGRVDEYAAIAVVVELTAINNTIAITSDITLTFEQVL